MTNQKQSDFTAVTELDDSVYIGAFTASENERIKFSDLKDQLRTDIVGTFIYQTVDDLEAADLEADADNPIYVRCEETEYRLYKITSLAASGDDIPLNNGNTATFQEEYSKSGFVTGAGTVTNGAMVLFSGTSGASIEEGAVPTDVGNNIIEATSAGADSYLKVLADDTVSLRTIGQIKTDLSLPGHTVSELALKAPIDSPLFTGNPRVPTASAGDNDTTAASTAFVQTAVSDRTKVINTVADLATTQVTAGAVYYLKEYNVGTGIGGGELLGISGSASYDNVLTFEGSGGYFKRINYTFLDSREGGVSDSSLPSGAVVALEYARDDYVAHSGGSSDIRNFLNRSQLNGAFGAQQMITYSMQSEVRHTAGTVTFAYGIQGFSRLGRLGSTTGDVTTFRGVEWHTANEGSGDIGDAFNFYSQEVDLLDGTGNIDEIVGFKCGDQGHATRITSTSIGFDCADFTAGQPLTAAFRSQMSAGTGRWAFYSVGGAASAFAGGLRLGQAQAPTDILETVGYAKLSRDGTKTANGGYHEINSDQSDYIVHIKNTNASTPNGVRVRFTGASPNNTTQEFIRCEDSSGSRMIVYSNGNIVNNNNSYGAISDLRLKNDISDAPSVLDKFRARQFKTYKLIGGGETVLGVIAQDELLISPNLVTTGDDGFHSYNYSGLAVEAAQAVKELLKLVDDLKTELSSLKEKLF